MSAVAVSALDDQEVGGGKKGGVVQDRHFGPSQVAGKDQPPGGLTCRGGEIQGDDGRAQQMPGVIQGQGDSRQQLVRLFIADAPEIEEALGGVVSGVDRFDGGLAGFAALPVDVLHVFFLDMAAVREHGPAEVQGGRGAEDLAPETPLQQVGNIAGVVDMGVRQHHGVHGGGLKGQFPVAPPRLIPLALIEAAFQQDFLPIPVKQVLGTGDRLGRSPKSDAHAGPQEIIPVP